MNTQNWLSLIEYSATYRVSLSTLRRRIKAGEVEFKLIEGKYLIKNDRSQVQVNPAPETIAPPPQVRSLEPAPPSPAPAAPGPTPTARPASDEYWTATEALLAELKKAFGQTLKAKDEQIVVLKNEVADLRMLVRVLEDEAQRLKAATPGLSFDLGLEA